MESNFRKAEEIMRAWATQLPVRALH